MSEKSAIADIFNCTVCGSTRVEEIMIDAVVRTEVIAIDCIGRADYGEAKGLGGRVDCYRCADCGRTIARAALLANARMADNRNQEDDDNANGN
jgi:hypothetical protein